MSCILKTAIAAFAASLILAPAVHAEIGVEKISVRVFYGDLDTSTQAGAETLLKRIKGAARQVCKGPYRAISLPPRIQSTCRRETVGVAVAQLNIATLTAAWNITQPTSVQLSAR